MHILVAEDDPRSSEFLTKGLTEYGFSVDVASDGEVAWQWIREVSYDLIILDVMMPAMDGFPSSAARSGTQPNHHPTL